MREVGPASRRAVVLSIVAGATLRTLTTGLDHAAVVRAMPNTPSQIRRGITVWTASSTCTARRRDLARSVLRAIGSKEVGDERSWPWPRAIGDEADLFAVMGAHRRRRAHGLPARAGARPSRGGRIRRVGSAQCRSVARPASRSAAQRRHLPGRDQRRRPLRAGEGPDPHRPAVRCGVGRLPPHAGARRAPGGGAGGSLAVPPGVTGGTVRQMFAIVMAGGRRHAALAPVAPPLQNSCWRSPATRACCSRAWRGWAPC